VLSLDQNFFVLCCDETFIFVSKMERQNFWKIQSVASSGIHNKNEKKTASFRRWLLWIPIVILASLLYILDIGGEMRYHLPVPNNITFSKYGGPEMS
jgi:hypothetical protein